MKRFLLALFILIVAAVPGFATHNNGGEITYRLIDTVPPISPTYQITVTVYVDPASAAVRDTLYIDVFDCNLTSIITLAAPQTNVVNFKPGITRIDYVIPAYTFPGLGCYRLTMHDPNRIDNIINMTGSLQVPFYLEDTIFLRDPQFCGYNSSPVLFAPTVDFAPINQIYKYNPAAYDPDGDSLVYSLVPPKSDPNSNVPGYKYPDDPSFSTPPAPNTFTINPQTGEITWNMPTVVGIYNVGILIREYRCGQLVGSLLRDFQIRITNQFNKPPDITELNDTCIVAGSPLSVKVTGVDSNASDILTITAVGGPFFVNSSPATFASIGGNPATGTFNWQTNCTHVRPGNYMVVFRVEDNFTVGGVVQGYSDEETWLITVVAPPPQNVTAQATANKVTVTWTNPYACTGADNFRGFSVWRKSGCDTTVIDTCSPGGLAALGYQKISGPVPVNGFSYTDAGIGGGFYSYRVLAEFAESVFPGSPYTFNPVSSLASNASCVEIPLDIPFITHVDVLSTDVATGEIMVRWIKPIPEDLDTLAHTPPYKYEIYRYPNMTASGTDALAATFTGASFSGLTDTMFTDSGLNTEITQYSYRIKFFATDPGGQFYEIGTTDPASSIFLSSVGGDEEIVLNWDEQVSWTNHAYVVFRETTPGSAVFVPLDTVATQAYTDTGLVNGITYCYRIRSIGTYAVKAFADTVINHSQIKCDIPIDTIPPCPPLLEVTNDCIELGQVRSPADILNELAWSPDFKCADDIVQYNIYYAPTNTDEPELLAQIYNRFDTTFIHDGLTSLAGCYYVTAVDSFDNESDPSEVVCVDNCPNYELPNVFTPNGDGQNDFFIPFKPYFFVDHIDMKIYNQWGNLVFATEDPEIMWDGKDQQSGRVVSEGVYYYVADIYEITVGGVVRRPEPLKGTIQVILGNGNTN